MMRTSRWLVATYAAIVLFGIVTALPNLFPPSMLARFPGWYPKQQVTLGLDLRGGSHLVLEVDARALIQERVQSLFGEARRALYEAGIDTASVQRREDGVIVTLEDAAQQAEAVRVLEGLATPVGVMSFGGGTSDLTIATVSPQEIRLSLTKEGVRDRVDAAVEQSLEIIRQRVDEVGVAEPTIQRVGAERILVQLPGVQDPARIRELLGSTAQLSFHMLAPVEPSGHVPPGVKVLPGAERGERFPIEERVALAGERLSDARAGFDQRTNQPIVTFRLDNAGARTFAAITQANVGKPFAIVLDGKVLSAPVIQEPITGGAGQISGDFTVQQTSDLAALLRAGALPAPLTVIEERTVGADLGSDAIEMGMYTGLAGFVLVFGFMFVLYGAWGLIANLALALNVILTFSALSLLGATLTLPGIAGIVLGIGLAVDANVLINERIREEARKGLSAFAALDHGFKRAYATIVDSNLTALIATALLFMFGSGPVRGFAVTMGLGIAISIALKDESGAFASRSLVAFFADGNLSSVDSLQQAQSFGNSLGQAPAPIRSRQLY
jgi:SecD/SecF fusion protein